MIKIRKEDRTNILEVEPSLEECWDIIHQSLEELYSHLDIVKYQIMDADLKMETLKKLIYLSGDFRKNASNLNGTVHAIIESINISRVHYNAANRMGLKNDPSKN